jgi:hypothetical protein
VHLPLHDHALQGKGFAMSFDSQLQHMKETYDQMEDKQNKEIAALKMQLETSNENILLLTANIEALKREAQEQMELQEVSGAYIQNYYLFPTITAYI